ncbi:MAG: 50S ribosomal protein L20 [Candidatus Levybacteria bacterium RIFCSPHIGHO2_12_FULL_38_12]|nr:MAG: 50S ribosomal protein L20 [Candidatus Levybacteria bacterium RIFCSPHIGHO2_01_FULL_38_12]OGH22732.1 MAG: 50S ribosomal protein L20 [Candidatus Levybacteria bacterium RIFCSPHIGHO2_12_FULL_38_12]OGH33485.1 MAG: 50S ribosomal protein L20 [Candidatus Levybacteria bacterium RIFCSPLOWO2_01_FULL_37_20]OGH44872.1 MAG: 50S ribosomal protein L20 [Candidatus Levybacteria bacterium RIFCSPLOWO2_02_FULL_37_18]OGH50367.1 MAG: 50S ribosomal protein L20 [Candidatus Levybacteria bacterium RIFCSPLOWO2_12_F
MARVKRGIVSRRKHKKLLSKTKGYRGTKNRLVKVAKEASLHAGAYAFHGRKLRKRDFRSLWITRIGEAVQKEGLSYSVFMNKLKKANIMLDRKMLNELLSEDPASFKGIVKSVSKN